MMVHIVIVSGNNKNRVTMQSPYPVIVTIATNARVEC